MKQPPQTTGPGSQRSKQRPARRSDIPESGPQTIDVGARAELAHAKTVPGSPRVEGKKGKGPCGSGGLRPCGPNEEHMFCPHGGHMNMPAASSGPSMGSMTGPRAAKLTGYVASVAVAAWLVVLGATAATGAGWLPLAGGTFIVAALVGVYHVTRRFAHGVRRNMMRAARVGMYTIEEKLGEGGMGTVHRARHQMLKRPAAIKVVHADKAGASESVARRRFEREAQVTAALTSPHTVQLYDFGATETGDFYYVMELLEGLDLQQLVKEFGPLPPARVVAIVRQALDSLAEAHAHGLVHRDVKPANLFLTQRGLRQDFVKVLDFGLVKPADDMGGNEVALTADGQVSGTPAYIAPEVLTGDAPVDGRADLYALACVAYYLLTGELVFEGQTALQIAVSHVTQSPARLSSRAAQPIPPALEELLHSALEKDPEDRPVDAEAFAAALDAIEVAPWTQRDAHSWWGIHRPQPTPSIVPVLAA